MVFHFEIGQTVAYTPKQSVTFGYPNTFWIVTEAQHYTTRNKAGPSRTDEAMYP
jgi:hypothetical protein